MKWFVLALIVSVSVGYGSYRIGYQVGVNNQPFTLQYTGPWSARLMFDGTWVGQCRMDVDVSQMHELLRRHNEK